MPRILANPLLLLLAACMPLSPVQAQDLLSEPEGWIGSAALLAVMILPAALFAWLFLRQRF
ncbi:MAG: hypothetical protein RL748_2436, partial [Pseudomonadota bacterium]